MPNPEPERSSVVKVATKNSLSIDARISNESKANGDMMSHLAVSDSNTQPVVAPKAPGDKTVCDATNANTDTVSKDFQKLHLRQTENAGGSESSGRGEATPKSEGASDDNRTHLSASFDSKSMASLTTFAMDEKESLRPDDSASVQAVEEDDFSALGISNSHAGSEAGNRVYRGRLLASDAAHQVPYQYPANIVPTNVSPHSFPSDPDEKLLDAMNSPKDRLLVLQLEEKIICFLKDSDGQSLELPPCNAYGRLLAHKLGDYYHLTHFVDNNATSVRLHRTPWSRVPKSLSALTSNTNASNAPPMRIMRRTPQSGDKGSGPGGTGPNSRSASKTASESGVDDEDGTLSSGSLPPKSLSREEREAKYHAARERIFKDFPSESSNNGDQNADVSRSNSGNGRRKGPRQKAPIDDTFEARSQYNLYYAGVPYGRAQPYHMMVPDQSYAPPSQPLLVPGSPNQPVAFAPVSQYNGMYQGNGNSMTQYMSGFTPPMAANCWQPPIQQTSYPPYPSSGSSPIPSRQASSRSSPGMNSYAVPSMGPFASNPTWSPSQLPPNFPGPMRNPPVPWPGYGFAGPGNQMQYFGQNYAPNIPSSGISQPPPTFNRSLFNPQIRSFVPASGVQGRHISGPPQMYANNQFPGSGWQNKDINKANNARGNGKPNSPPQPKDSIAKWGTPANLPPKPPPSEIPSDFDLKGRPSLVPQQAMAGPGAVPPTPSNGPLVVSGNTAVQKPRETPAS